MFYSHQLLARKAPLGQIWMAATMHAKINRKKLDKLNIIKICEEILNPSVPMALRLSGILMGGVVIVYERKVKLLFDDVSRLLVVSYELNQSYYSVEINEAWKIKALPDPTVLPKGKSQAKYEAVTMPERMMGTDEFEEESLLRFSNTTTTTTTTTMQFHQEGFITMRLDHVEEPFINVGEPRGEEEDMFQQHHQADTANITLFEPFNSYREEPPLYNRFERFDIEGDEDTHVNFTPYEYSQVPTTLIPSPPLPEAPPQADEIRDQHPEPQSKQLSDEGRDEAHQVQHPEPQSKQESDKSSDKAHQVQQDEQKRQGPTKRKTRRRQHVMDYEQTIIPGHVYQSWLQNPSDMVSKRGRKEKHIKPMSTMKTSHLMELPPVALVCGLSGNGTTSIHYPRPLLELWMRSTQLQSPHDSPSGRTSDPQPPEPVYSSAQDRVYQGPVEFPVEDFHSGIGSQPKQASIEKQMPNLDNLQFPVNEANLMFTPGNSGDNERSIPSSASGNSFLAPEPEVQVPSGRSNIKRPYSSSRRSGSSLAPVAEENPWELPEPDFKLRRLSENGFSHEQENLVETGPTPTQHPLVDHPIDKITDAIRKHLKTHFETPGAPQIESLDQLASGMNRKKAAQLFYQTCVLASHDLLRVQQTVAFADILISRGSKM